jgi:homocitrate synthase NifV
MKNPTTYEVFAPEEVGLARQLVIGKHSGSASIRAKFMEFAIELDDQTSQDVLAEVRKVAVELKRSLFSKELMYIYQDYLRRKGKELDPTCG